MFNPVNYMKSWLNTTYDYLKETGGPVRPPNIPTTGIDVPPTGPYTAIEDLPQPVIYGPPPNSFPFNPGEMGLPAVDPNKAGGADEMTKQGGEPTVFDPAFGLLYYNMRSCINDQHHGHSNPLATQACQDFADHGDYSKLMLVGPQLKALGLAPPVQDKPDTIRVDENGEDGTLTNQIGQGYNDAKNYLLSLGQPLPDKTGTEEEFDLQAFKENVGKLIPKIPGMPETGGFTILMFAGGAILLLLLLRR